MLRDPTDNTKYFLDYPEYCSRKAGCSYSRRQHLYCWGCNFCNWSWYWWCIRRYKPLLHRSESTWCNSSSIRCNWYSTRYCRSTWHRRYFRGWNKLLFHRYSCQDFSSRPYHKRNKNQHHYYRWWEWSYNHRRKRCCRFKHRRSCRRWRQPLLYRWACNWCSWQRSN